MSALKNVIRKNTLFYQLNFTSPAFSDQYISLRQKEGRVYSNDILCNLPNISATHPLRKEWAIRKNSLQKLIRYLHHQNKRQRILELGCGNGWLAHRLASSLSSDVYAMDVNERELEQGVAVFKQTKNLTFICGDIFTCDLDKNVFDTVILAASIQYFPDFKHLIQRLLTLLAQDGEIHIIDSPFYDNKDVDRARKRSEEYFSQCGFPSMKDHYHHHSWDALAPFNYKILYNPEILINRIKKYVAPVSPFPWIKVFGQNTA